MDDLCLLKESLEKRNPVLFLGAGFSYKSLNGKGENVELASGLCNHLYNYFFTDESTNDDQKSVALSYKKNNDLKKLCELIRVLDKTDERNQFFVDYFSGCHIDIKDSRNKICDYPFKKFLPLMLLTLDREVCMIINESVKTIKTTIVDKTLFDLFLELKKYARMKHLRKYLNEVVSVRWESNNDYTDYEEGYIEIN